MVDLSQLKSSTAIPSNYYQKYVPPKDSIELFCGDALSVPIDDVDPMLSHSLDKEFIFGSWPAKSGFTRWQVMLCALVGLSTFRDWMVISHGNA